MRSFSSGFVAEVGLVMAAILVLILVQQNRSFKARLADEEQVSRWLAPGSYAPATSAATLDNMPVHVGVPDNQGRQAIFFFNTTCPYCQASISSWNDLYTTARATQSASVIGVSFDSVALTRSYVTTEDVRYPVTSLPSQRIASIYKVTSVPLSLIVDSDGRVLYSHNGPVDSLAFRALSHALFNGVGTVRVD